MYEKFFFRNRSIRTKLVLTYSVLIIVFIGVLSSFSYFSFLRIIRKQSFEYTTGIMEQVRNNIDDSLQNIDQASYIIFSNPELLEYLRFSQNLEELDSWQKYHIVDLMIDVMWSQGRGYGGNIFSISLYDNYGTYVTTSKMFTQIPFERIQKLADISDGRFAWLHIDNDLGIVTVVRKIRDMEMNAVGYLRFDIRLKSITDYFSEEVRRLGGVQYILENEHLIIGDTAGTEKQVKEVFPDFDGFRGKAGYYIRKKTGGDEVVVYSSSRFNDWVYVSITPLSELTKSAFGIRNMTVVSSIISIIFFSIISFFIINQYTRPIHQIAEEMKKIQIKNWLPSISYTGNDEISYLTDQFGIMAKRIGTLVDEMIEEKTRYHSQQIKTLLTQINPHFLYNTLDVVNWMAREKGIPEIGEIVKSLSEMMRYSLKRNNEIVYLSEELDYIKKYLYIQSRRFVDKFQVVYDMPPEYDSIEIPKFILQPIVENSILHGFSGLKRKGLIVISARIKEANPDGGLNLIITISDNGVGMSGETVSALLHDDSSFGEESHHGIGLGNVQRRIQLLYGTGFGLDFKRPDGGGTVCEICLPLQSEEYNGKQSV